MSYSSTVRLGLKKAVVGSNQPFETAVVNENWDKVDAEFVAVDVRLDGVEGSVTSLGSAASSLDGRLDVVEPKVSALESLTASGSVNAANTAANATRLGGRLLSVGASAPSSPAVGDLWIQV